jgi:hypothetical protein
VFIAIAALIVAQRLMSDGNLIPVNERAVAYPRTPLIARMQQPTAQPLSHRRHAGRADAEHRNALRPRRRSRHVADDARVARRDRAALLRTRGSAFVNLEDLTRPFLSLMNVRYAVSYAGEVPPAFGWREVLVDRHTRLSKMNAFFRALSFQRNISFGDDLEAMKAETTSASTRGSPSTNTPAITRMVPASSRRKSRKLGYDLDANMTAQGFVVISEAAWQGWRAYVDGEPAKIHRANHAFLGVSRSAGTHRIRLVYLPRSFVTGRNVTLATLLLLIGVRLFGWRWRNQIVGATPATPR